MISIPPQTLNRPPQEGARIVALRLLKDARSALERTADPDDPEALHDLRVRLRRLRSSLRAYQGFLKKAPTELAIERARSLGSRTNEARDLQAQIEWLTARRARLSRGHRAAADYLLAELERRLAWVGAADLARVETDFMRLYDDLRGTLVEYSTVVRLDEDEDDPSFGSSSAGLVEKQGARLNTRLQLVESAWDEEQLHRVRIEAKRLRYLIEPLSKHVSGGPRLIRALRSLQNILGEFNDLRVLFATLTDELEGAALGHLRAQLDAVRSHDLESARLLRRRPFENGLLALATEVQKRKTKLFDSLERGWLGESGDEFFADLRAFSSTLRNSGEPNLEIEHKFLLEKLPDACKSARSMLIDQGWLSGKRVRERLRRVTEGDEQRFLRTIKLGSGLSRQEFEEPISRAVFERFWPLTEGSRVSKRRYLIPVGSFTWEIDEFLDRDLVLAEIEVPTEDTEVVLPDWLLTALVREVTEEPDFANVRLAK